MTLFRPHQSTYDLILKRTQCPVLMLLASDRDRLWPEAAEKSRIQLMRAKAVFISGGHHLHLTNVTAVLKELETFYAEINHEPSLEPQAKL